MNQNLPHNASHQRSRPLRKRIRLAASVQQTQPQAIRSSPSIQFFRPSLQPAWRIPGVGILHPSIDRVVIVSTASVGTLKKLLPIAALQAAFHSFHVLTYSGPDPRIRAKIIAVGAGSERLWTLLTKHEKALQRYRITEVEFAYDAKYWPLGRAESGLLALLARLDKRWHQRGYLHLICKPGASVSPGYLPDMPTAYYEHRRSSVAMKCYARKAKLPGGRFGGCVIRLEWTLKRKRALVRYLGGNRIDDLLTADLNAFLVDNLRLARVDHVAVGKLFNVRTNRNYTGAIGRAGVCSMTNQWRDSRYRSKRAASLVLRVLAYREFDVPQPKFATWEQALHVCNHSPAQVRGYLRELGKGTKRLSDYRINGCFRRVRLQAIV